MSRLSDYNNHRARYSREYFFAEYCDRHSIRCTCNSPNSSHGPWCEQTLRWEEAMEEYDYLRAEEECDDDE